MIVGEEPCGPESAADVYKHVEHVHIHEGTSKNEDSNDDELPRAEAILDDGEFDHREESDKFRNCVEKGWGVRGLLLISCLSFDRDLKL